MKVYVVTDQAGEKYVFGANNIEGVISLYKAEAETPVTMGIEKIEVIEPLITV